VIRMPRNAILPSTRALTPIEDIKGEYVVYVLERREKVADEYRYQILSTNLFIPKYSYFLTLEHNVMQRHPMFKVYHMMKTFQWQIIPERFMPKIKRVQSPRTVPGSKYRALKTKIELADRFFEKQNRSVDRNRYFQNEENKSRLALIDNHDMLEITFKEQLLAFLEMSDEKNYVAKLFKDNTVAYLRDLTKSGGVSYKDYIDAWAKRLLADAGIVIDMEGLKKQKHDARVRSDIRKEKGEQPTKYRTRSERWY
jgi:hypothetical protein